MPVIFQHTLHQQLYLWRRVCDCDTDEKKFVDELHWITEEEMLDMTALAESAPGAIAVNAAILVGWQMEGLPGMMTAVVGTILPPMVILSIISYFTMCLPPTCMWRWC